jgi:hypothetical protein
VPDTPEVIAAKRAARAVKRLSYGGRGCGRFLDCEKKDGGGQAEYFMAATSLNVYTFFGTRLMFHA